MKKLTKVQRARILAKKAKKKSTEVLTDVFADSILLVLKHRKK